MSRSEQVFGLHPNFQRLVEDQQGREVVAAITRLAPLFRSHKADVGPAIVADGPTATSVLSSQLALATALLSGLPSSFDAAAVRCDVTASRACALLQCGCVLTPLRCV
jgi:hypothetical protein